MAALLAGCGGCGESVTPLKVTGRVIAIKAVSTTGGNTGAQDIAVHGH